MMPTETTIADKNIALARFMGKEGADQFIAMNYKYHSDWNLLMPVIEKISKIKLQQYEECQDTHYPRTFGMLDEAGRPMFRFNCSTLFCSDTLIEAAHAAVYDFILWYNTQ